MTTKPKAKKFRIRRSADTQSAPSGSSSGQAPQAGTEQTESSAAPAAGAGQPTRRPEFSKVSAREDEGRTGPAALRPSVPS